MIRIGRRARNLFSPFRVAVSGLVFTFRTQRHMRFHLYVVLVVLALGVLADLQLREMLVLLFTISLVVVAEMFNSAIEAVVDLASPGYHPMAKFAKDIAAGAVLITTIVALVVGGLLIVGEDRWEALKLNLSADSPGLPLPARLVIGLPIVFIITIIGKGIGKRGTVFQGGLVSGHAAYAFYFALAVPFVTQNVLATGIAILLACIVAQSRFEARFHSVLELVLGAGVGTLVAFAMFGTWSR